MVKKLLVILFFLIPILALSEEKKITVFELNKKLLAFSDNYQESISEAIDTIIVDGVNPSTRVMYHTIKVFYTNSAIGIATESDAIHQLLDMMVMLRLQRITWDNGCDLNICTKAQAKKMSVSLGKLETQLHILAREVFTQDDINVITSLAEKWHRDNPTRHYVAFVRFQNFDHSEDKAEIQELLSKGGLFSTISETNREIEETRYAIERGMFLLNHMPILMEWQSELFLYKFLATDEIKETLAQSQKLTQSLERITTQVETLPSNIDVLVNNNSEVLLKLTQSMAVTSENLRVISAQLSPLFLNQDDNDNGKIDLAQIQLVFKDALATSKELAIVSENLTNFSYNNDAANHLSGLVSTQLNQADSLLENQFKKADELLAKRLDDLDSRFISHRELIFNQVFKYMLLICFGFPLVFFTAYLLVKRHIVKYEKNLSTQNN